MPPSRGPPKNQFFLWLNLKCHCFMISADTAFTRQIFWHSLGVPTPRGPPKWTPQKWIFWRAQSTMLRFYDISRYLTDKYFDIVWGCHPPSRGTPKWTPQKSIFWTAQLRVPVCFDISRYLTDKYFDRVWGCHHPEIPQMANGPPKINFLNSPS